MHRLTSLVWLCAGALLCAQVAFTAVATASSITYDDLDAFLAHGRDLALEDFDSGPWAPPNTPLPQPVEHFDARWTSPEGIIANNTLSLGDTQGITTVDGNAGGEPDQLNADLPAGTRAVGGWVANAGGGNDVLLSAYDSGGGLIGSIMAPTSTGPPLELGEFFFVGIGSLDVDIARVEFVSLEPEANDDFALDDFYFGGWHVPEPASLTLALIAGAAAVRRRVGR